MKSFLAFVTALFLATSVLAQGRPQYSELNPPQPTVGEGGKIEVVEFFWYGCPHCYSIEPLVEQWKKSLPPEAVFRPFPAVFNARWGHDAAIFYTFEALGVLDKLHRPFFDAIHRDRLRSDNIQALNAWLEKNGVDPKKFDAAARSFGVQSKVKRAIRLTSDYKIEGTPAMAVHGRYTVGASDAMLDTVNQLVASVRKKQ